MITRQGGYFAVRDGAVPAASEQLQASGYAKLEAVFTEAELQALRPEVTSVYDSIPPDRRNDTLEASEADDFRYEMINRSPLTQRAVGHPEILKVIEPLLGEDCHLIANTCWRNPKRPMNRQDGGAWHIDAGPHIPRAPGIVWDDRIPYPVFVVAAHLYLSDCPLASGPTAVIPGSHKSGQFPPPDRRFDVDLSYDGVAPLWLEAKAGDVVLFVSDCWHRRMPSNEQATERFFIQAHYGRRDIAQRLRPTDVVNHLSSGAMDRAQAPREKTLLGLHPRRFYDG